ncbi:MAG: LicD family protein [Chloroflexi bacterium]|nr:LicD family protein [Chloroflexota bacterium]
MQAAVFEAMDMSAAEAVLKEVKQVLDERGLIFFLRHGTCLGAVRDKAFIGWDDDVDTGSVIGMHGLTEERIYATAEVFRQRDFDVEIIDSELHLSVDMKKSGIQFDWTCYRIIDDSIYQWPAVKIPTRLYEEPTEIDFLGETFHIPNPPEEYLELKYGPEWRTPKQTGFEQDVLALMPDGDLPRKGGVMTRLSDLLPWRHAGGLRVLDQDGNSIEGANVGVAPTTVLSGIERSITDARGFTRFRLPEEALYVLEIRHGEHEEVLYMETLSPGINYVYRPDPEISSGRYNALVPE